VTLNLTLTKIITIYFAGGLTWYVYDITIYFAGGLTWYVYDNNRQNSDSEFYDKMQHND